MPEVAPGRVAACVARWGLTLGTPYPADYSWVAPAERADGTGCVLKLVVHPDHDLAREAATLQALGAAAIRLLEADLELGALLLERADPGTPLSALVSGHDERATGIACSVMQGVWQLPEPGCDVPTVATLVADFNGYPKGSLPDDRLVQRAAGLFAELADGGPAMVLHGDLHHDNILAATRLPWLAADPHGVVGDPAYEVGSLVANPLDFVRSHERLDVLLAARLDVLCDRLGFDRDHVMAWAFAKCVLSEVWSVADDLPPDGAFWRVAETLDRWLM